MAEPMGFQARCEDHSLDIPVPMWDREFRDAEVRGGATGVGDPSIARWMGLDFPGDFRTSMPVMRLDYSVLLC